MAPHALGRLIPEEAAVALQSKLNDLGVGWHFNTTVQSIDRNGNQLNITLANGSVLNTDVVLSAVGLRPKLKLAKAVGIATNIGIQVNRELETNISHIYAIGDCAEVNGMVLPCVTPIMQAAQALAATLTGNPTSLTYPAMPVMVKTPAFATIVSPPAKGAIGQWKINTAQDGLEAHFESPQ